jgi:hypothetical protein
MKWQKNSGVMPCEGRVKVRFKDGSYDIDDGYRYDWDTDLPNNVTITHYCIGEVTYPPFDYVEPKVWTVHAKVDALAINKHGVTIYNVARNSGSRAAIDYLIDALNAMEERNGTE